LVERRDFMNSIKEYLGEKVCIKLSGEKFFTGLLIDVGSDVVVIYDGKDFIYLSSYHIQSYKQNKEDNDNEIRKPAEEPVLNSMSLRTILTEAKGNFVEIYVTSNQMIQGYVTSVMNDYFVFYSPIYKTMYISIRHLKWFIPYSIEETPYDLNKNELPVKPSSITLARTLEEQLKKSVGKLIVFDLGENKNKVGKIVKLENNQIKIVIARSEIVYINYNHIKTVHFP
jgi:ribosome maturation factor RimP